MSRSIVMDVPSRPAFEVVARVITALSKMRLSKPEGIFPIVGQESLGANMPDGVQNNSVVPMATDYPLASLSLPMSLDTEFMPKLASDPFGLEGIMPLDLPVAVTEAVNVADQKADQDRVPETPLLNQVQPEEVRGKEVHGRLDNLLGILEGTGMKVKNVTELPSGATRITFDEFMGALRQLELVRVRR